MTEQPPKPKRRRIVGCPDSRGELGVADAKRQTSCLHRLEMRLAHHAADVMPGQREPHRKMTADGARAENAYAHGVVSC